MKTSQIFFKITKQVDYGQAIYLVFSFINWNLEQAIRMECQQNDQWTKSIDISYSSFEYKYVIGHFNNILEGEVVWEIGLNRSSENLKLLKMNQSKIQLDDVWEKRNLIFFLIDRNYKKRSKQNNKHHILLFGQARALNSPVKFTNCKLNQKTQLYFLNLQLETQETITPIEVQIYMQAQIKGESIEIISKSIKLNFSTSPINIYENILKEDKFQFLK